MDERNVPGCGEIIFIKEIYETLSKNASTIDGKSIRVTGRLDKHNTESSTAVLVDPKTNKSLLVNTMLIEPFASKLGCLFQVIGELESTSGSSTEVTLRARVVRCVDGLDLTLYEEAILSQRQYLSIRS